MTLDQLSGEAAGVTGSGIGFVIKSLLHPERKFRVCYKFTSGKYGITRLDSGKDFLVDGSEDRYDFAVPVSRVREALATKTELLEQKGVIETRLAEIETVIGGLGSVG